MPADSSFDIVSKVDLQEVLNGINNAEKEILNRYDFRDSNTSFDLKKEEREIMINSADNFRVQSALDVLLSKMAKRNVPLKALTAGDPVELSLKHAQLKVTIQDGIPQEKAKDIVKAIKDSKLKVQASIQKDVVRVTGKSKDDLQAVMALLKAKDFGIDMQFTNYR